VNGGFPQSAPVPVLALEAVDSTNAEARRRAEAGEPGPLWITAERQTEGRGRRGRVWETGQGGNLAATLLMLSDRPPAEAAQISFIAALAVCDLARSVLAADRVRLKWPNDVLIDGVKVAGILIESGRHLSSALWLAVGIGVNLAWAPAGTERPATSFTACGAELLAPHQALDRLAAAFAGWLGVWDQRGFAAIAEAWTSLAYGLGEACTARLGQETIGGVAEGLDVDGALRLRGPSGEIRRITAGDVFFGVGS
jgi:BirA family biotin operon repressor/biotin-[acetyl-CoA-carboxylase] ligase